jgi:hypothetical protein
VRIFWLVSAAALTVLPAQAETARSTLSEIAKCSDIATAAERLQCYDNAAATAKSVLAASPQQQAAVETEEEGGVLDWFGLGSRKPITKAEDFGKTPEAVAGPREISEISAAVTEFAKNAYGKAVFILDNGQVWRQIDGDAYEVQAPRKGDTMKVTIEKAFMGSFSLTVEGRNGIVKVRRIK